MGRHSRRDPAATADGTSAIAEVGGADAASAAAGAVPAPGPGTGRRRRRPAGEAQTAPAPGTPRTASVQGAPGVPRPRGGGPQAAPPAPATPAHGFAPFGDDAGGAVRPAPDGPTPNDPAPKAPDGPVVTGAGPLGYPFTPQNRVPAPRQDYVDAFEDGPGKPGHGGPEDAQDDVFAAGAPERAPRRPVGFERAEDGDEGPGGGPAPGELGAQGPQFGSRKKSVKGRTFTGVAAAAVTTVLAVVVAGQVAGHRQDDGKPQALGAKERSDGGDAASRSQARPTQPAAPASYDEKMARAYPLDEKLTAAGEFEPVGGDAAAPGHGKVERYRVDVEKGMGLDGELFADAVHKTLNDERSWAHGGRRAFQRVGSGDADFVITLASPGTTAKWCAKSGLDTTEDNVSCDSAATERVMINAYRWARGAETYGPDRMHAYRQMLINHEVGHRLGRNHEGCSRQGALAPVMMQQTKFLTTDGATCRPNAWPFPGGA
ncbi:DUF3152 domain-containing protein [Streptomyces sp. NPDC017529]|uniref:DUF3152 domain-containing protein n=1 Tax=Streptomyces sp. NPDC017529 TaxID=3365000 RepID=UPI00378F2416